MIAIVRAGRSIEDVLRHDAEQARHRGAALAQVAGTSFTAAVIGPQTELAAREAGFTRLILAEQPTLASLSDAVQRACRAG